MCTKFALSAAAAVLLILACAADARHVTSSHANNPDNSRTAHSSAAGRRPHPVAAEEPASFQQGRVFPGALALKKIVLLKFKKIIPISMILLKADNDNEAQLVPVYPTSEIPSNVQFIPTPNGISGHKDVQAIAIPTELHEQLEANGISNIADIEALLQDAQSVPSDEEDGVAMISQMQTSQVHKDNEPLDTKDEDEDQLLPGVTAEKPSKVMTSPTNDRRLLAADDLSARPGLRGSTQIEEIPLYLYSTKDKPQGAVYKKPNSARHHFAGRRHHS